MENSLGFKDKHSLVLGKFKKTRIYYHFQERLMFFVVESPVKGVIWGVKLLFLSSMEIRYHKSHYI